MAEQFNEGEIIYRKGTNERYQMVNGRPQRLPDAAPADPNTLGENLGRALGAGVNAVGRGLNRFSQAMNTVRDTERKAFPIISAPMNAASGGIGRAAADMLTSPAVSAALPIARAAMQPQGFNFRPQMPGKEAPLETFGRTPIGRPAADAVRTMRGVGREAGESLSRFGQNVASGASRVARGAAAGIGEAADLVSPLFRAPALTLSPDQAAWYLQQSNGDFDVARMAAENDGYLWPGE